MIRKVSGGYEVLSEKGQKAGRPLQDKGGSEEAPSPGGILQAQKGLRYHTRMRAGLRLRGWNHRQKHGRRMILVVENYVCRFDHSRSARLLFASI